MFLFRNMSFFFNIRRVIERPAYHPQYNSVFVIYLFIIDELFLAYLAFRDADICDVF